MVIFDEFKLTGKVAIVTGGYSHLGSAFTEVLAEANANVVIAGRDSKKAELLMNRIGEKLHESSVDFVYMDISSTESIRCAFREVWEKHSKVDILVNNAVYCKHNILENMTDEEWNYCIDGTLNSLFRCIREITPYMKKQKSGSIINISSMYGMISPDFRVYGNCKDQLNPPNYGAAKAGVIQLTKYCAVWLAKYGIRVNCISPGPFPSHNVQRNKEFIDKLCNKVPLGRIGKPEDLKGALVFLASDASSYVMGHNLVVDGGWTIW